MGYSPWGREELDTTERLAFSLLKPPFSFSAVRRGLFPSPTRKGYWGPGGVFRVGPESLRGVHGCSEEDREQPPCFLRVTQVLYRDPRVETWGWFCAVAISRFSANGCSHTSLGFQLFS